MPEGLAFVFDGGPIGQSEVEAIRWIDPEIHSVGLFSATEIRERTKPSLAARIAAALEAVRSGKLALCEAGRRVALEG